MGNPATVAAPRDRGRPAPSGAVLLLLAPASGLAGLAWEVVWQHHAALALGVSALGTALTLACVMAGMAVGAYSVGRRLERRSPAQPLRLYAMLEMLIGVAGLALVPSFALLERLDAHAWHWLPSLAPVVHVLGVAVILAIPTTAMGATLPAFRVLSDSYQVPLSRLYALNTLGAAVGVPVAAFALIPAVGVFLTSLIAVCINLTVALVAWIAASVNARHAGDESDVPSLPAPTRAETAASDSSTLNEARAVVFTTGFVAFVLEVAWFRSLKAAFLSTTEGFAVMLTAVLLPLAVGARLAPKLKARRSMAIAVGAAGALALAATPIIERFDTFHLHLRDYWAIQLSRLAMSLAVMGPPILLLGAALPWFLDQHRRPRDAGSLYGINTVGAVLGSLAAGFILLPTLGSVRTAWLAAALLVACGALMLRGRARMAAVLAGCVALGTAIAAESGVGRTRVQGAWAGRVLASAEGPDANVSVVDTDRGERLLFIDGFQTTGEATSGHYMAWMGRLPMLLHPNPRSALVICFGTGQTANAVRQEGPAALLDIVELSPAVIRMAPFFASNEGVLDDPRVKLHIMDGRAWLRRTEARYDVVTLEPMAPGFAGTNALYSSDFYELVAARLNPGGVVAQWLPFHILAPVLAASITRTFVQAFPDALMWIDPVSGTGILVGRREDPATPRKPTAWPGLDRPRPGRDLEPEVIARAGFGGAALTRYAGYGTLITDDNQVLAYGTARRERFRHSAERMNLEILERITAPPPTR